MRNWKKRIIVFSLISALSATVVHNPCMLSAESDTAKLEVMQGNAIGKIVIQSKSDRNIYTADSISSNDLEKFITYDDNRREDIGLLDEEPEPNPIETAEVVTTAPVNTPEPTDSLEPTGKPEPTDSEEPTATPSPGPTQKPSITPSVPPTCGPSYGPNPTQTVYPSIGPTTAPNPTVTPSTSNVPVVSKDPRPTVTPKPSLQPTVVPTVPPNVKPKLIVSNSIINVGRTVTIKIVNAVGSTKWSSSKQSVAVVSKGVVKALKEGKTVITAKNNGYTLTQVITVTNMSLSKSKSSLTVGKKFTLKLTNTRSYSVIWTTSNASVATVSKGAVTGKKIGTATITACCRTVKFTCKVTVMDNEKQLTTYDIKLSDIPKNQGFIVLNKVAYSGADLKISATVFNNYARKLGTASAITITLNDGKNVVGQQVYRNCRLNVKPHSKKSMVFYMTGKYIKKKNMDLRTSKMKATVLIDVCTFG